MEYKILSCIVAMLVWSPGYTAIYENGELAKYNELVENTEFDFKQLPTNPRTDDTQENDDSEKKRTLVLIKEDTYDQYNNNFKTYDYDDNDYEERQELNLKKSMERIKKYMEYYKTRETVTELESDQYDYN